MIYVFRAATGNYLLEIAGVLFVEVTICSDYH